MRVDHEVLTEDEPRVNASRLVVAIQHITGPLVDSHHSDIRAAPQRFLQPGNGIIRVGIWAARSRIDFHQPQRQTAKGARQFGPGIDWYLLAGDRIDPDLAAEKHLVLISQIEIEDPRVLQKKLALFGNENLERRQIELLLIDIGVCEIRISSEVQDKV